LGSDLLGSGSRNEGGDVEQMTLGGGVGEEERLVELFGVREGLELSGSAVGLVFFLSVNLCLL